MVQQRKKDNKLEKEIDRESERERESHSNNLLLNKDIL